MQPTLTYILAHIKTGDQISLTVSDTREGLETVLGFMTAFKVRVVRSFRDTAK